MNHLIRLSVVSILSTLLLSCSKQTTNDSTTVEDNNNVYPSELLSSYSEWSILLGNGDRTADLKEFDHKEFFYTVNDGADWIVYKAPNSGVTSRTSSNTRTELGQKKHWLPKEGGNLTGTCKVMHVSTSGDARVAASYSVVIGQIHSSDGHENEPLKIFYKKFPCHTKGSVYWNYEINTEGENTGRWDFSTAVWGHDMSVIGSEPDTYPDEPSGGIELGEEFSYEINVYEGMMYLTFISDGHETKTFTKNLLESEFVDKADIPQQIIDLYTKIGRDGTEKPNGYTGELQYFKQGAYNQTNGKDPADNMVWSTGSETYDGDIAKQYANGCYAEVWFRNTTLGAGKAPVN